MIFHQIKNSYGNYNYNAIVHTDVAFGSHFHSNYELIYAMEGETRIAINGVEETLGAGELILISPHSVHSLELDRDVKAWVGVFSQDYVLGFAEQNRHIIYSKFRCCEKIEGILREQLFFEGSPEHYMLTACLYMVCNECVKNAQAHDARQSDRFMYRVIRYISDNTGEEISLKKTAEKLGYEYHYFSALFNRCFGMNFKSFINILRFESACRLLADKALDITDVSNKCGFSSIRNFNRVFKQLSGMTPGEYRRSIKK